MAVPKKKKSKSRTATRKAQWLRRLAAPTLVECPQCHEAKLAHHACPACGYYNDRQVVAVGKDDK